MKRIVEIYEVKNNKKWTIDLEDRLTSGESFDKPEKVVFYRSISESEAKRITDSILINNLLMFKDEIVTGENYIKFIFDDVEGIILCNTEETERLFKKYKHVIEFPTEIVF